MKVAVNTRLLLTHRMEGIARFIYETTKGMVLNNPDVEFHFLFDRPFDDRFIFADNVIPHVLNPPSRHPILWYLWFEHAVPKFLMKNNIDVFYSGDMYLSLKTRVPTLLASHDLNYIHYPEGLKWSHLKYLKYYFPKFHDKAKHIITVSEYSKQDIIKQYGIDENKVTVAYNAVSQQFDPIPSNVKFAFKEKFTDDKPFFIYVGSLHPRKNLERLLLAFDLFKTESQSDFKLVLFGRIAFKNSSMFKTFEALKFKDDVIFLNDKQCDIALALGSAFALCYVSLFEGFGIPILESFQCEVPVITSNVSSMPEVAGNATILVDPLSITSIKDGMLEVISDEKLQAKLIYRGKERLSHFSWDKSAEIIFEKLLQIQD